MVVWIKERLGKIEDGVTSPTDLTNLNKFRRYVGFIVFRYVYQQKSLQKKNKL